MHQKTIEKIRQGAKFLNTPTAVAARGNLHPALETALKVIDQFADGTARSFDEIAEASGLAEASVKQIIRALEKGGYPIQRTYEEQKIVSTGRKPISIAKKKESKKVGQK